jgi:hypothetical protein
MEGSVMAEYRVEITIREDDEKVALALLATLERRCPTTGPIMVQHVGAGTLEYVLATDASNAIEACSELGEQFVQALGVIGLDRLAIVALHGDAVPADELDEFAERDLHPV